MECNEMQWNALYCTGLYCDVMVCLSVCLAGWLAVSSGCLAGCLPVCLSAMHMCGNNMFRTMNGHITCVCVCACVFAGQLRFTILDLQPPKDGTAARVLKISASFVD